MHSQAEKIWIPVIKRRGSPVLFFSFMMAAYDDRYFQEILLLPRGIHDTKYLDGLLILEANDMGILERNFTERIEPAYLSYFIEKCRAESDHLLATAKRIGEQGPHDSLSNPELAVLFTEYVSDSVRVFIFLPTIVILEGALQKAITERLSKHLKTQGRAEENLQSHLNALIFPKEKSIPSQAILDLYELGSQLNSSESLRGLFSQEASTALPKVEANAPEFYKRFQNYLGKYDFLDMEDFVGSPLSPKELFARILDVVDSAEHRLADIKADQQRAASEFQAASDDLQLPPDLRALVACAQKIHYQRQHRSDAIHKGGRDVLELMNTIAARLAIDYDTLITLTHEEISHSLVAGRLLVDQKTIATRAAGYGIRRLDAKWGIITGKDFADELASVPEQKERPAEIRGDIAHPGRHRGCVAVVTTKDEVGKVRQGDVLVSPMTNPHFVPAMVRAGAIVTDEGGILSHAAIISRELGVPCIIGTQVATALLKDGDIVEVQAQGDSGVVMVIERQKEGGKP